MAEDNETGPGVVVIGSGPNTDTTGPHGGLLGSQKRVVSSVSLVREVPRDKVGSSTLPVLPSSTRRRTRLAGLEMRVVRGDRGDGVGETGGLRIVSLYPRGTVPACGDYGTLS